MNLTMYCDSEKNLLMFLPDGITDAEIMALGSVACWADRAWNKRRLVKPRAVTMPARKITRPNSTKIKPMRFFGGLVEPV